MKKNKTCPLCQLLQCEPQLNMEMFEMAAVVECQM